MEPVDCVLVHVVPGLFSLRGPVRSAHWRVVGRILPLTGDDLEQRKAETLLSRRCVWTHWLGRSEASQRGRSLLP